MVNLVDGKRIVVDSKVAFAGYLEAMEARDEFTRAARLKAHARHLRRHVDDLGAKAYWNRFSPSPEFVVCFVPADAFLDAALREDPALLEHAFARNVILATPTTLVALLRTVGYTWRQQSLARNTAEVSQLGRELYQRLAGMGAHLDKLGRSLNAAVGSFNSTVGTLEGRVLVSARRLADLSVVDPAADGELPETEQILAVTRTLDSRRIDEPGTVSLVPPCERSDLRAGPARGVSPRRRPASVRRAVHRLHRGRRATRRHQAAAARTGANPACPAGWRCCC